VGVRSDGPSRGLPAGAWVRTVRPDSPAAKESSIRVDDVIVAVDGVAITSNDDLVRAIRSRAPGSHVRVTVARGHERVTEAMFLESMPPEIWRIEQRNAARQR
jgi:S1-C subfamily serine protease